MQLNKKTKISGSAPGVGSKPINPNSNPQLVLFLRFCVAFLSGLSTEPCILCDAEHLMGNKLFQITLSLGIY